MQARQLFHRRGYADTEMEDIRKACGVSRGGLYHHFANKAAILDAIVMDEVDELASRLACSDEPPIEMLLEMGSSQLGNDAGIMSALHSQEEKLAYLSSLDRAIWFKLSPILSDRIAGSLSSDANPEHVAELFLTINAHINRRVLLGDWTDQQGAGFAATALAALVPFFEDAARLRQVIQSLQEKGLDK